ncbi:hypothetical protein pCPXV0094 [Cowpox virus]|uniref:Uncharacterized protein n=1 Tax=Cowpox virus TaxID=10243 RepID=A0A0K2YSM7_COWPX|nr:hypothetical protein pCPXV0094 [Cowpox virus]CUI02416.1 hypothetical protein pCPXV0094 [Cowpox virus]SNB48322.1 hypothetical protein pCPXV0094 [Cowpox virus]SNB48982.1 hypothetical protein pCPXV0094 [Cowpox virus]SNB50363.1 hypothetical protein pCPXV0094 [Cowpox virus]
MDVSLLLGKQTGRFSPLLLYGLAEYAAVKITSINIDIVFLEKMDVELIMTSGVIPFSSYGSSVSSAIYATVPF